jgi:DMSO/TMAO reductase YedYZ molybdopterin-dependent catalytic subunit
MHLSASLWVTSLAVTVLRAQGLPQPMRFPPDLGPAAVTIIGVGGKPIALTAADLFNLPQHTVRTADHGTPATFEGVLLTDVLAKVDLPAGEKFHSTAAAYYLVVEAADGYRAVFAWAELDSTFMDKPVYLATHRDGKPLPASDGPFELVAPGEKRNARWVRQVTALTIRLAS